MLSVTEVYYLSSQFYFATEKSSAIHSDHAEDW